MIRWSRFDCSQAATAWNVSGLRQGVGRPARCHRSCGTWEAKHDFPAVLPASPSSLFQYVQRYLLTPARMAGRSLRAHPYDTSVRGRSHDRRRPSLSSPSRVLRPVFHPPTPPKAPTVPRLRKIAACSSMHAMFVPRHRTVARARYRGIPAM